MNETLREVSQNSQAINQANDDMHYTIWKLEEDLNNPELAMSHIQYMLKKISTIKDACGRAEGLLRDLTVMKS